MAVPEQTPYIEYTANGVATSFALGFNCESKDHLIVTLDGVEPPVVNWSLTDGEVVFTTAPSNGVLVVIQRNTPFSRTTDYQSYNNSFRPPVINNDFDRVWWKIQELGVRDWLLDLKIQKFRDDVNLTALENTLEEAKQIRDDTADSVVEVQSNVAQSQSLLTDTTNQANLAQGYASSANSANAAAQQAVIDVSTAEADVYSALSAQQIAVNNSLTAIAGGHKAYQTLALAQADQASLPANTVVEVTNDPTSSNNGTYQWNGTTLTKSAFDPVNTSKAYTDAKTDRLFSTDNDEPLSAERIYGYAVNVDTPHFNKFSAYFANRSYLALDVSEILEFDVTGSTVPTEWRWLFADSNDAYMSLSPAGKINGTFTVPEGAKWAYRTYHVDSISESPSMQISGLPKNRVPYFIQKNNALALANAKEYVDGTVTGIFAEYIFNVPIAPIPGAAIISEPQDSLFANGASRAYLKLDVSTMKKFVVSGAMQTVPDWKWVFCDLLNNYLATSPNYGNGEFLVPQGAKWAYRTWQVGDLNVYENEGMTITGVLASTIKDTFEIESKKILNEAEEDVDSKVYGVTKSVINLDVIQGYGVQTTPSDPRFVIPQTASDVRAHIKIDVRHSSRLKVSNSIENSALATWYWVFETDVGGKIITPYNFNVEFDIPENVIYAYRSVFYSNASSSYDDIANGLKVELTKRTKIIQPQIDILTTEVKSIRESVAGGAMPAPYSPLVEKMLDMFNKKSFISPNDFADETQTERIKSAVAFVKKRGFGIIELAVDKQTDTNLWTVTEAITLPSNCWVYINKSTVKRGDGVFDNIFRNDGIVPDPDPFNYAEELNPNENILIFGNSKADSFIDGNLAGAKVAPHPVNGGEPVRWVSDWYGWRAISILFANTQHHHVFNLSIINSQNWSISNEHGCSNFSYHDLYFNTSVKNGDGVNVRFGCHDFEIYNIEGRTSDDTVAINSLNNLLGQHPQGSYIFPSQVGGFTDRGLGKDIYNGEVYNIKASSNAAVSCYLSGGSKLYDLNFNNISELSGKSLYWLFQIDASYGGTAQMGDCYNITVNNVTSEATPKAVKLNAPIKDCWFNNVTQNNIEAIVPAVSKEGRYVGENVVITNVKEPT